VSADVGACIPVPRRAVWVQGGWGGHAGAVRGPTGHGHPRPVHTHTAGSEMGLKLNWHDIGWVSAKLNIEKENRPKGILCSQKGAMFETVCMTTDVMDKC